MVDVLKQFRQDESPNVYAYGEVISVGVNGKLTVRATSGLTIPIRDAQQTYSVGDQLVLGKRGKTLDSIFIIRKISRICPTSVNVVIQLDQS